MKIKNRVVVHNNEVVGIITNRCRKDHKWVYTYRYIKDGKVLIAEDYLLNAQIIRNPMTWQAYNMLYNNMEENPKVCKVCKADLHNKKNIHVSSDNDYFCHQDDKNCYQEWKTGLCKTLIAGAKVLRDAKKNTSYK